MTNTKPIKLSEAQKRVIQLMREHGYYLVFDLQHRFFRFERNGRDVSYNVSSLTAKSLVNKSGLLTLVGEVTDQRIVYRLTELGKQLIID